MFVVPCLLISFVDSFSCVAIWSFDCSVWNLFSEDTKKSVYEKICYYRKRLFPKIVVPQNGWFRMEIPINMHDLGVALFLETPIYIYNHIYIYVNFRYLSLIKTKKSFQSCGVPLTISFSEDDDRRGGTFWAWKFR